MLNFPQAIDYQLDAPGNRDESYRPPSRLEIQRRHLEYKKMNHAQFVHEVTVRDRAQEMERHLARRRMVAESRLVRTSVSSRLRRSVGQALISAGERIRTELT